MSRKEIEDKVLECVYITYKKDPSEVTLETTFKDDLGGASILLVGVVSLIENEMDVLVSLPEASTAVTVKDLVDLVEEKM